MCLENVLLIQDKDVESTGMPYIHLGNRQRTAQTVLSVSLISWPCPILLLWYFFSTTLILNHSQLFHLTSYSSLTLLVISSSESDDLELGRLPTQQSPFSVCVSWLMWSRSDHVISFAAPCLRGSYAYPSLAKVVNDLLALFKSSLRHSHLNCPLLVAVHEQPKETEFPPNPDKICSNSEN